MTIQIGNFSGLFEVGIALNLSYSFFEQVRSIGKRRAERAINKALREWKDAAELLDNERTPVDKRQIANVEKTAAKEVAIIKKRARGICAVWVQVCIYSALFCFIMLAICGIWGQCECTWGRGGGWFLLFSAVLSCSMMPAALLHIGHTWKAGEGKIRILIDLNRQSWDVGNDPRAAARELKSSVDV